MLKSVTFLIELAKTQGFGLVLISAFAYYMYYEKIQMQTQLDKCNSQILELYQTQNDVFREVVEENTEAVKAFSIFLQNK